MGSAVACRVTSGAGVAFLDLTIRRERNALYSFSETELTRHISSFVTFADYHYTRVQRGQRGAKAVGVPYRPSALPATARRVVAGAESGNTLESSYALRLARHSFSLAASSRRTSLLSPFSILHTQFYHTILQTPKFATRLPTLSSTDHHVTSRCSPRPSSDVSGTGTSLVDEPCAYPP